MDFLYDTAADDLIFDRDDGERDVCLDTRDIPGAHGHDGAEAPNPIVLSFAGGFTPGALEARFAAAGDMTFDADDCPCSGEHGGDVDLTWRMTVDGADFATFTIHPDGTGATAFSGPPTVSDRSICRVYAPLFSAGPFSSFSATLRSSL